MSATTRRWVRATRTWCAAAVVGVVGTLTGTGPGPTVAASVPPTTEPEGAPLVWGELGADGEVTVDVARQAFADLFGTIGDVEPSDSPGAATIDPSGVLAWIEAVWGELTPDEQADAQAVLDSYADPFAPAAAGLAAVGHPASSGPRECTLIEVGEPVAETELSTNRMIAERWLELYSQFEADLGRAGPPRLAVCAQSNAARPFPVMRFGADNTVDSGAPVDHCNLFYPVDFSATNPVDLTARLSMMMARCFWATAPGASLGEATSTRGAWFIEGPLFWAASTVAIEVIGSVPEDSGLDDHWDRYLEYPSIPLTDRLFDAVGFFAQVEQAEGVWGRFDVVTHAADSASALAAASGSGGIYDIWGAGYLRDATIHGPDWDITGPGITDARYEPEELEVPADERVVLVAPGYAAALATVSTDADLVAFASVGRLRVADASIDETGFENRVMCTRPDGDCRCPDSPDESSPEPLGSPFVVAITNATEPGEVSMAGVSLEEFCRPQSTELLPLPDPCTLITQTEADIVSGFATRPWPTPTTPDEFPELGTGLACPFVDAATPSDAFAGRTAVRITVIDLGVGAEATFEAWAAGRAAMNSGSIEGLGDANFYFSPGPGDVALLYLRQQNLFIAISALVPNGLDHVTNLARLALGRL